MTTTPVTIDLVTVVMLAAIAAGIVIGTAVANWQLRRKQKPRP